jgi:TRAP transporter TAXI family solute receptor
MPTREGSLALKLSLRTLLARWLRGHREDNVEKRTPETTGRHQIAKGVGLDAIEDMMNRRLRAIWVRHTWFVIVLVVALLAVLTAVTVFLTTEPTTLRIAVGPAGSDDVKFVRDLAARMAADKSALKLQPVIEPGPVDVVDIRGKTEFDLAVVRGNMNLSADWPVVAILRQDAVAIMVPPAGLRAPAKDARNKKAAKLARIEKVTDLAGKRVGIVAGTDGGEDVLDTVLAHYGVARDSVKASRVELTDLQNAVKDDRIDAVLVAGPQTGTLIEKTVVALTHNKKSPTFIAIDQAEGIGKRTPPYESADVPAGAFGGVPPSPPEELKSLKFPVYIVARKNFNSDKIAAFSKSLYTSRQALAYALPGIVALESPSTDKDASVLVHPGTADYLGDNQKSFFDKYGDEIFYGLLIFPVIGSGLAGVAGYFRADKNTRRVRQLHRLLRLVRKARTIDSLDELDRLQDEADAILGETIHLTERGQLDEIGLSTFTLAIDQARAALSEQRLALLHRIEQTPPHLRMPRADQAAE